MSPIEIGGIGVACLIALLSSGIPIGVSLGLVSFIGIAAIRGWVAAFSIAGDIPYTFTASWSLTAIPMFIFMGALASNGGLIVSLFRVGKRWLAFLPGGLAVASNFASAGFAAASGSSMATAAAMGRIAVPEMLRAGYDPKLATAVVAASGTLGSLIPPSVLMVIYGWLTQQSIGKLLLAGLMPGLLTAAVYTLLIITRCALNPRLAPKPQPREERIPTSTLIREIWPLPVLIFCVIGGIYSGITTATEAAALGALAALAIAVVRRQLTVGRFKQSVVETLESTAIIFVIAIGASLFTTFLGLAGVPQFLSELIRPWTDHSWILLLIFCFIYLILGMFLDPLGIMLLTLDRKSTRLNSSH